MNPNPLVKTKSSIIGGRRNISRQKVKTEQCCYPNNDFLSGTSPIGQVAAGRGGSVGAQFLFIANELTANATSGQGRDARAARRYRGAGETLTGWDDG